MTEQPTALPLAVDLRGARVLGVGAGPVAWRKYQRILEAGAALDVIAPEAVDPILDAAREGRLGLQWRVWAPDDLDGALLVVAGTADGETNAQVAAEAAIRGTLCVRIDGDGSAALAAEVRRGPLILTVSTSGQAPALARRIRADLEDAYDDAWGRLAALMGELRRDAAVRELLDPLDADERARRWRAILTLDILGLLRTDAHSLAKEAALACLSSPAD